MQWISRPQLILKVSRNSNNLLYPLPLLAYFKRAPALLYDYTQTRPFTVWSLGSLKWPNITEAGPGKWNNFIKARDQKFPQHINNSVGLMPHLSSWPVHAVHLDLSPALGSRYSPSVRASAKKNRNCKLCYIWSRGRARRGASARRLGPTISISIRKFGFIGEWGFWSTL